MLATPGGRPASSRISPSTRVEPEVSSLGLTTAVQPAASANGSFWLTIRNGKFHGVMIATTPMGSRTTTPSIAGSQIRVAVAVELPRQARRVPPEIDGTRYLAAGLGERLAALERVEQGQLLGTLLDQIGHAQEHAAPLGALELGPRSRVESPAGGHDRRLGVGRRPGRVGGHGHVVRRARTLDDVRALRWPPRAVDQEVEAARCPR